MSAEDVSKCEGTNLIVVSGTSQHTGRSRGLEHSVWNPSEGQIKEACFKRGPKLSMFGGEMPMLTASTTWSRTASTRRFAERLVKKCQELLHVLHVWSEILLGRQWLLCLWEQSFRCSNPSVP